jgi:non-canonical poly(A) RNA polymerase PAPD5/7
MAVADQTDFQRGEDFISFGGASPPPAYSPSSTNGPAQAGPSRLPLGSTDTTLLNAKNRRTDQGAEPAASLSGAEKKEKKRKAKGKGKETEGTPPVAGKKRARGPNDPVGPKNLKEERRAAERLAPWTDLVDWDSCHDPAEMCVSTSYDSRS